MSDDPADIMEAIFGEVSLNILLFGPPIRRLSNDVSERPLQDKRLDIFDALTHAGHHVRYAEEVVEPGFTTALPYDVLLKEYDLVFSFVSSSTGVTELEIIGSEAEVARKSMVFLDDRLVNQSAGLLCNDARGSGADVLNYSHPNDVVSCRLLTETLVRTSETQTKKHIF